MSHEHVAALLHGDDSSYDHEHIAQTYTVQIPVNLGMYYLDAKYPGWELRVNLASISISSPSMNVLAQVVCMPFSRTWEYRTWTTEALVAHGFTAQTNGSIVRALLSDEWRMRITKRLENAK